MIGCRLHPLAICFCVVLSLTALVAIASPAQANRKYASVVVSEETGDVFYARNSKSRRYPASLTKVMTLYLLFEELSVGKITLDSTLKASSYAARQPPSKLGIKAGQKIKVRDAIKALVVRSANDVAVVVAEGIAGSERAFAKRMTQRARALGMTRTTFRNASGLPNRRQITTAYDMAIMARSIARDYPQYFHFFNTSKFTWKGRTWRTHNHVLKRYKGADGIKTGYTRASGFNLITTAERNGTRLVGVVLGGRTPRRRDRDMYRILNLTFGRIAKNPSKYRGKLMASIPTPVLLRKSGTKKAKPAPALLASAEKGIDLSVLPTLKPAMPVKAAAFLPTERPSHLGSNDAETTVMAAAAPTLRSTTVETTDEPVQDTDRLGAQIALSLRTAKAKSVTTGAEMGAPAQMPDASTKVAVAALTAGIPQNATTIGKRITVPLASAAAETFGQDRSFEEGDGRPAFDPELDGVAGTRGIQVGAFTKMDQATRHVQHATRLASGALPNRSGAIVPAITPSGQIFRVRFGPLSERAALNACDALKSKGMDCFPIQDENWKAAIRP